MIFEDCALDLYLKHSPVLDHFFFNDTATTDIYTLSLHDALPIFTTMKRLYPALLVLASLVTAAVFTTVTNEDRKSTRLNSSHSQISYAVFCLKKKIVERGAAPQDGFERRLDVRVEGGGHEERVDA